MNSLFIILLGLLGLGILVFVHELGHFLMAKAVGIEVEAFALGWGKTIWAKQHGATEYRIAIFPIGGYCKMKGEIVPNTDEAGAEVSGAQKVSGAQEEAGSLYSVSAWKRILTYLGGPLFNLIFAILIFAIIGMTSYTYQTYPNTIELAPSTETAAYIGGLESGDTILAVEGKPTPYFEDIRMAIASRALMETTLTIARTNEQGVQETFDVTLTPRLNEQTGAGVLGIYAIDEPITVTAEGKGLFASIGAGFTRTFDTLTLTLRGLRNLFRGVDASEALSGPVKITYMLGDVAVSSLQNGIGQGLRIIGEFMALISIALAFGNLLPIPALDGGQICMGVYEGITKRRISPKVFYRLQLVGFSILIALLLFTLFNDLFSLLL